jgi:multisubunit Na+/H+ antiporter MnhC subunit
VNRMHHNHKTYVFIYFSTRIMNTALNSAFVCCTEDKKRRTAHTQTQLGHETTAAPVPSRLIHTSLPHCVTVLLSFCSLCKSMISVHDALSKFRVVAMFLNVACSVVTFLFHRRTKFHISSSRLIS